MGIYTEYLDKNLSFNDLCAERKEQLKRISKLRKNRDILVYAADLAVSNAPTSIEYDDLLPINDQLANLTGNKIDIILETPGGSGEVVEDIVRLIRGRYEDVAIIIPGWAKSAGTILAMAGDEILMEPVSALGPIDAQLNWQGKVFSADALLEGIKKIKEEVTVTNVLNKAYIPILQGISPGELQSAQNALDFAKKLVTEWLVKYKFKTWDKHSSTGKAVTDQEKKDRADEIARLLCNHSEWLTHGRSIKLDDFERMRLKITDYSKDKNIADAIRRYYTLTKMTFAAGIYKIFETQVSQIYRLNRPQSSIPTPAQQQSMPENTNMAVVEVECSTCKNVMRLQANLQKDIELKENNIAFPADNKLICTKCKSETDVTDIRRQIEAISKKSIII